MRTNQFLHLLAEMATFVRVVDCGSFSAAAAELGMTPSAVSRHITRLERALALRLLERTTRKLRLSEAGAEAYRRCAEMVRAARATMALSGELIAQPQGLLRVSMPKAFGRVVLSPLMPAFLRAYPDVTLQLIVNDRSIDPIRDQVDLVISITERPVEGLAARPLMAVPQVLCASPAYLAERGTPRVPQDLAGHSCLSLGADANDHQWRFRRAGQRASVSVAGRLVVNHSEMRLDGVLQHLGIGCLPQFTARQALADGRVVAVLPDWEFVAAYQGTAYIQYLPTPYLAPTMRVFIDYLVQQLAPDGNGAK